MGQAQAAANSCWPTMSHASVQGLQLLNGRQPEGAPPPSSRETPPRQCDLVHVEAKAYTRAAAFQWRRGGRGGPREGLSDGLSRLHGARRTTQAQLWTGVRSREREVLYMQGDMCHISCQCVTYIVCGPHRAVMYGFTALCIGWPFLYKLKILAPKPVPLWTHRTRVSGLTLKHRFWE